MRGVLVGVAIAPAPRALDAARVEDLAAVARDHLAPGVATAGVWTVLDAASRRPTRRGGPRTAP